MLTVVHDSDSSNEDAGGSRSLLDEIVRDGARQMLAAALAAEVAAYIDAHAGEVDEHGPNRPTQRVQPLDPAHAVPPAGCDRRATP